MPDSSVVDDLAQTAKMESQRLESLGSRNANKHDWELPARKPNTGWMISYMDIMTLLVALFALLLSQARVNGNALGRLADGLRLGSESIQDMPAQTVEMIVEAAPTAAPQATAEAEAEAEAEADDETAEFAQQLREQFDQQGLSDQIKIRNSDRRVEVQLNENLMFPTASAELMQSGQLALRSLVDRFNSVPATIAIEGHSDDRPIATRQFPSNWELSASRAAAVARLLVDSGIPTARVSIRAFASTRPVAANDTAEGRRANRRVNLILQFDGNSSAEAQ